MSESDRQIDPRLRELLEHTPRQNELEAFFMVDQQVSFSDTETRARELIERVSNKVHEKPSKVKIMPRMGVIFVRGACTLIDELTYADEVRCASANMFELTRPK